MSTDAEIIRRSIDDPPTFAVLFDRHGGPLVRFAARRVGRDAAEDVLSETFLVAFRRREQYDQAYASAMPWLLGIATRLIHRHRAAEARQWRALEAAATRGDEHSIDEIDGAGRRLDAEREVRALIPAIRSLSTRDRETLLLVVWGDLAPPEAAAALGVPVGTVWSRLHRVRRRLGAVSGMPSGGEEEDGIASAPA